MNYEHIDIAIGQAIKSRRTMLGYSQEVIGEKIGVTFQQIQKYEKGANSLNLPRLFQISDALGCRVTDIIGQISAPTGTPHYGRRDLEMMKRFRMLKPHEQAAIVAFLNTLCARKHASKP
jgi:transcriptional regulator with XRE-family HTH domain